jgi:hypothetical protein
MDAAAAEAGKGTKIPIFGGEPSDSFTKWSFIFEAYLTKLGIAACIEADHHGDQLVSDQRLCTEIRMHVRGDAIDLLRNVPKGHGFRAWRALNDRYLGKRFARESRLQVEVARQSFA